MLFRTIWILDKVISLLILGLVIIGDGPRFSNQTDQIRGYTRAVEFDYPTWVWDAIWDKFEQASIGAPIFSIAAQTRKSSSIICGRHSS